MRGSDGGVHELRMDGNLRLDDLQSIVDATIAGVGLAWLPCWLIARHVRDGTLELLDTCDLVLSTEIHAVWPRSRYLPSKTRVAIDALTEKVPEIFE